MTSPCFNPTRAPWERVLLIVQRMCGLGGRQSAATAAGLASLLLTRGMDTTGIAETFKAERPVEMDGSAVIRRPGEPDDAFARTTAGAHRRPRRQRTLGVPTNWHTGHGGEGMITRFEVVADSPVSAREMAISQARAQGYTRIEAVFTTSLGERRYKVQMTVSR